MSLSLATRKNIRDNTPKMEEHLATIEEATGQKFTYEVDFPTILTFAEGDWKERIGELIYDSYLSELAWGIKRFCEDPLQKEALLDCATARKISFHVFPTKKDYEKVPRADKLPRYCRARVVDGVIVMETHKEDFPVNVGAVRDDLIQVFAGEGPLSLACRIDIAKTAAEIDEKLTELEEASGIKMEVEVDYAGLKAAMPKDRVEDLGERLGTFVSSYIASLVWNCARKCKEDEMNKEAFVEICSTKKIKFNIFKTAKEYEKAANYGDSYGRGRVVGGDLVIELNPDNLWANVDYIFDFDKMFAGA